jgi:hypothetical protein
VLFYCKRAATGYSRRVIVGASARTRYWLAAATVIVIAVLLALAYGTAYGSGNQQTYLLDPLHHAFPELYKRDWLVAETTAYHPVFGVALAPLFALDPSGRVAFGIAQLVVQVATYVLVYRLVAAIAPRARVAAYALLASLLVLGAGRALAGSYLFAGYLQPSSLATVGWLVAMIAYIRDRPLACGLALAFAGVWHVNFLVLGIGWFALLEVALARGRVREVSVARLVRFLAPSLVVLVVFLPSILAGGRAQEPDLALHVLVRFHTPGHYDPKQIRHYVPSLVGWLAFAWGMRGLVAGEASSRAMRLAIIGAALCVGAVLVASIPPLLGTTRLYVWRIAPFAQLASQTIVVIGAFAAIAEPPSFTAFRRSDLVAIVLGLATVIGEAFHQTMGDHSGALAFALGGAVVGVALAFVITRRTSRVRSPAIAVLAALAMCCALASERRALVDPPLFAPVCNGLDCKLLAWTQTTPVDALFLVPPYMNWFRLGTRRAIVADIKSPPLYPDELVAWYRRLCDMVEATESPSTADIEARWDALAPAQLLAAARRFHAEYLVLDKTRSPARIAAPIAFEDSWRIAYRVSP